MLVNQKEINNLKTGNVLWNELHLKCSVRKLIIQKLPGKPVKYIDIFRKTKSNSHSIHITLFSTADKITWFTTMFNI